MTQNILITGGAGNLARHVADELKGQYKVTLFDLVTPDKAPFPWETDLLFVQGNLTSLGDCMRAITLSKAEVIIHLGAIPYSTDLQPGMKITQKKPEDTTMNTNVMGTYYLMDAARRLGVKKVIFASSYYTLGLDSSISDKPFKVDYLPIDEEHPNRAEDTYSLSKVIGEEIIEAYSRAYGIKAIAFRLMGISYPYSPHKFDIAPSTKPGHVGGPIGTTWQYVDARDVAIACRLAVEKDLENDFEAFYLSTDNQFAGETCKVVERLYPDLKDMAANIEGTEGIISIKKIRDMLGYKPQYSWKNKKSE